jgi:hypothetical protein
MSRKDSLFGKPMIAGIGLLAVSMALHPVVQAQQSTAAVYDFTKPVVLIEPLNMARVKEIAAMLPEQPKGFGETYHNRAAWERLRNTGKYNTLLKAAEKLLQADFPAWSDSAYLAYFAKGTGTSVPGKKMLQARLAWLVQLTWAECLENKGRYVATLEKTIRELINQKSWVNPTHDYDKQNFEGRNYFVELSASSYGHNLAQALFLLDDKLSPAVKQEAMQALDKRMFAPVLRSIATNNKDNWWLTFTNNFNAVCLSGVTGAALTVLPDRMERAKFVAIAERYSKNGIAGFLPDGYCTEGIGYYNYGFGHYIVLRENIWQATQGKLDLFNDPKINRIARFLPKMEVINNVYSTIGDCHLNTKADSAIVRYLSRNFGMQLSRYNQARFEGRTAEIIDAVMYVFPNSADHAATTVMTDDTGGLQSYFENAGILTVRPAAGSNCRMGVTMQGGNNAEHHNHNDVGSLTIVIGNEIMMGDPGSIPYTSKTFGPERYTYKTIASYGHPVPLVAGKEQRAGLEAAGTVKQHYFSKEKDSLVMDIAAAYEVPALQQLTRDFVYNRTGSGSLEVRDHFAFKSPDHFETALITRVNWKQVAPGVIELQGKKEKMRVVISTGGHPFHITSEVLTEGGTPYTRLGIVLDQPVAAGTVQLHFTPVENYQAAL